MIGFALFFCFAGLPVCFFTSRPLVPSSLNLRHHANTCFCVASSCLPTFFAVLPLLLKSTPSAELYSVLFPVAFDNFSSCKRCELDKKMPEFIAILPPPYDYICIT